MGLFAQIEAEAPFLLAYWTDNGRVLVPASQDSTTIIAGVLDLAVAAAEVMITVSPTVSLSAIGAAVELSDFPDAFVAGGYLRATSPNPAAVENVTAQQILDDLLGQLAGEGDTKVLRGSRSWYALLTAGGLVRPDRLGPNPDTTKILHGDGSWRSAPPFLIHVGAGLVSADLVAGDRVRAVSAGSPVNRAGRAFCRLAGTNPLVQALGPAVDIGAISTATLDATVTAPASGVTVELDMQQSTQGQFSFLRNKITELAVIWRPA